MHQLANTSKVDLYNIPHLGKQMQKPRSVPFILGYIRFYKFLQPIGKDNPDKIIGDN